MDHRGKSSSADLTDWHRIFGILLTDLFDGSDWEVELELDLSIKQQLLDIVVIRRGQGHRTPVLPDGFGARADHNLITYKSLHEPLDAWALKELVGHSVNYRKQRSPAREELIPESSIRLFAIATQFPEKLSAQISLQPLDLGLYDVAWGTDTIRVLVLKEIPDADRNTILNLFSSDPMRIAMGLSRYSGKSNQLSSVVEELLKKYHGDPDMPQSLAEMIRDSKQRVIADIPASEIVEFMTIEKARETKALIERRLAEPEKKKPVSPRATKGRRKTGSESH
ncbi:MAG: hypothetical protein ACKV2Q_09245 [Planctomycetaceae bacterium]